MLSCRDVTHLTASGELERAGWLMRVRVRLHRLMCRHCRAYARQLRLFSDLFRGTTPEPADEAFAERIDRTIRSATGAE